MKKNIQHGFSAVALLLLVVLITIIGGTGWYVWNSNKRSNDILSQADKSSNVTIKTSHQSTKEIEPVDEASSWKEFNDSDFGFSFKHPTDAIWKTYNTAINPTQYPTQYSEGDRALAGVIYDCGANCGAAFDVDVRTKDSKNFPVQSWGEDRMKGNTFYSLDSKSQIKLDGITGTRWEYQPAENNVASIIFYSFSKGQYIYLMSVNNNGAKTDKVDVTSFGEKILSTFKFSAQ
jgi:hypothetical protein